MMTPTSIMCTREISVRASVASRLLAFAPLCVLACGDSSSSTRHGAGADMPLVSRYDAEHPSWKMHPGALIVEREDPNLVYDLEVKDTSLTFPTAPHAAFLEQIVPGRTILVTRENDQNPLKNPGFIRRVLEVRESGANTEVATETLYIADIVRGHLDSTFEKPWGIAPTGGATPSPGAPAPQALGGRQYAPVAFDRDIDVDLLRRGTYHLGETNQIRLVGTTTQYPAKTLVWLDGPGAHAALKGHAHLAPLLDFALDIDVGIDWGWEGPRPDIVVTRARAGLGLEYEATGDLDVGLTGAFSEAFDLELFATPNFFPGCNIGGIPCGINLEVSTGCTSTAGGAVQFQTKGAKVFGTPLVGAEYSDGALHQLKSSAFNSVPPSFSATNPSLSAQKDADFGGATKIAFDASGSVDCRLRVKPMAYVGTLIDLAAFKFDARLGAWATVAPSIGATWRACTTYDVAKKVFAFDAFGGRATFSLKPEAAAFGRLRGGREDTMLGAIFPKGLGSFDLIVSIGDGWTLFTKDFGNVDPTAPLDCATYL